MARKKSADEIADLKSRLRAQADLYKEAEPLLPIAEALRDAINARLLDGTASTTFAVDAAFDAALGEVAEAIIASKLETLDAETVLEMYADHVADDVLRDKLRGWAAAKTLEIDFERRLDVLRQGASRSGRVALEDIDDGMRVTVGMYEPLHVSRARRESSIPPARTVAFRLLEPPLGRAEVISDVSLNGEARDCLTALSRGTIGSLIVEDERSWLEPTLQLHGPLGYDFGAGPVSSAEVIGFVEVGDGVVVLG